MADLIDREALMDIVGKMPLDWEYGKAVSDIYDIIKAAPAVDAVEVVRCKECRRRGNDVECPMCYGEFTDDDFIIYDNTDDDAF